MKKFRNLIWFTLIALVAAILLRDALFTHKGLVPADGILTSPPWKWSGRVSNPLLSDQFLAFLPTLEFTHQQKSFPLWNPDIFCGAPNLAAIQFGLLFPVRLAFLWLDPFAASALVAFTKLCLAGWFTLLFVRALGVSNCGAFLASIAFSLCGFIILWLGHPIVSSAIWLPLLLYFIEKSFVAAGGRAVVRWWFAFSIAFACMILGGHPPTIIQVGLIVTGYFLFRLVSLDRKEALLSIVLFAGALIIGALLAAPQLLPYFEYYSHSSSAASSQSVARWTEKQTLPTLIHFLLPNVLGNPSTAFDDLADRLHWPDVDVHNAMSGYVGVLPLFFAGWAVVYRRSRFVIFFAAAVVVSLLVVFAAPPFPTLIRALPVIRDINQTRLLLMVAFGIAVLAGFGWDEFNRASTPAQRFLFTGAFYLIAAVAVAYFWFVAGPHFHDLDVQHRAFVWRQFLLLAMGVFVVTVLVSWPSHWTWRLPTALCATYAAADLLYFGHGFNPAISRDQYYPQTEAIEWLQKDRSLFRVFAGATLPPNSAEVFGLSDVRGCDFMTVQRYEQLITGQHGDFAFYTNPQTIPEAFPLLNAKYLLLSEPAELNPDDFEMVYSKEVAIYRFKRCLDRALLVYNYEVEPDPSIIRARVTSKSFDPAHTVLLEEQPEKTPGSMKIQTAGTARIDAYEPNNVRIDALLEQPGFLLLLDTYFPGWEVTVNGRRTKIYRADYNFRAVQLPAGKSTVQFAYRPRSLRIGLWLAAAAAVIISVGAFGRYGRRSEERAA